MSVNREIIGYVCDNCGVEVLHDTNPGSDPDLPVGWTQLKEKDAVSGQHVCPECIDSPLAAKYTNGG